MITKQDLEKTLKSFEGKLAKGEVLTEDDIDLLDTLAHNKINMAAAMLMRYYFLKQYNIVNASKAMEYYSLAKVDCNKDCHDYIEETIHQVNKESDSDFTF